MSVVVVVLLGTYALWFFKIQDMKIKVESLATEIAAKTNEYANVSKTLSVLQNVVAQETEVNTHLVPTNSIVAFLESIENLGEVFGTLVTVVSVSDPSPQGEITLALSIKGSFDAVMHTLGLIEHSQFASATKTLTLDTTGEGEWTAAVTGIVLTPHTP